MTSGVGAAGAGVALRAADGLRLATADTDEVASVDRVQDEHGQGPRSEAVRRQEPVAADDLRQCTERWPVYASRALESGFVSVVAVPIRAGDEVIGVLDLYDRHARRWSADDLEAADLFLDVATGYAGDRAASRRAAADDRPASSTRSTAGS